MSTCCRAIVKPAEADGSWCCGSSAADGSRAPRRSYAWCRRSQRPKTNAGRIDGELSLRIVRGLSVDFEANASRIRDQLSLPRRSATPEEVLLRRRELQSGYEVSVSFGVTYSFGSLFNDVVNPRFGNQ